MKFRCENIGMISSADVEINKISVIAGLNSTGKSTIGKAFYCLFNGLSDIENEIKKNLKSSLFNQIYSIHESDWDESEDVISLDQVDRCTKELLAKRKTSVDLDYVKRIVSQFFSEELLNKVSADFYNKILDVLKIPDETLRMMIVQRMYNQEFKEQLQNVFLPNNDKSSVSLTIKKNFTKISIQQNKIFALENAINIKIKAFYIDNPFDIDLMSTSRLSLFGGLRNGHQRTLLNAIRPHNQERQNVVDEYLADEKIKDIENKLTSISNGSLVLNDKKSVVYHLNDKNVDLSLSNVSAGLKAFVIIKALLKNGVLKENGVLILDEPEIHLHPEWQKKFAEIIVMMQKTFNMHILISSHSPYFINALDVYEQKYGIRNDCRFYLTVPDGESAKVDDVSENLEPIYKLLFEPMQALENERASLS
ncbi:MAG: ATP-binding protein [Fibrobacter sp.]|nr:ATP-binding protein [Fibrobacter sp.]MBR6124036.1 ATP-binding protein [Candidatus Saccharibacteria bacterium]